MAKKTAGVSALVKEVLSSVSLPYTEDVIEEVFILIENSPAWKTQYEELRADPD